jgi:putative membrane protein
MRLPHGVREDVLPQLAEDIVERDRIVRRSAADATSRLWRKTVRQHALIAQRCEVPGNYVSDLAAKPLHGRVVQIERRLGCGHGARSMTGRAFRVNRRAATIVRVAGSSSSNHEIMRRTEATLLLLVGVVALIVSGIRPADPTTWLMEVAPIFIAVPILFITRNRFPLTPLVYRLIFVHALILMLGGHYTYAKVPLGFWMQDLFGFARNHYDRIGHFAQGFVPAMVAREILLRTSPLQRGKWLFVIVTSVCLAISACYEFVEWWAAVLGGSAADAFLGTQGDVWDTQWDMFMAFIGAMTAQLTLARIHDRQLERV